MAVETYEGGCQCGRVRYRATFELGPVISCNCSRCQRLGWLIGFVPQEDFELVSGDGETAEYLFNRHAIHHTFCKTCGIESYAWGKAPSGADMVAVNVRCLDGVDTSALEVQQVDGRSR